MLTDPVFIALAALLHAGLLLLAGTLVLAGRGRAVAADWGLTGAGVGVMASVAAAAFVPVDSTLSPLVAPGVGLWAAGVVLAARFWRQNQLVAAGGALGAALLGGYLALVTGWPQIFRDLQTPTVLALGVGLLLTTAASAAVHTSLEDERRSLQLRGAGALVAAVGLALPALLSGHTAASSTLAPLIGPCLALLACLLLACALLLTGAPGAAEPGAGPERVRPRDVTALDSLTQLPTRVYFESRLAAVAQSCESKNRRMALFFIDLDGFKPINDTFGHQTGDQVLEQVGKRLRQLSGRKGLSARIGGDEFLLLLSEAGDDKQVAQAAKQIITVMSQPYSVEGREIVISCSVGIAMYPDNCSPAALITRADAAMYSAKRAGGSRHCFYSPELDEASRSNFELLADLRNAVAKDEFELHYQPKIDAKTGQVTAAEALLRWRHPQRGVVMPGDFINVAERFGLIGAIGDWVINDACRQVREWREKGLRMRVAINLSAHQMRQDDIVDRIAEALKKYSVHPSLLTCEITETASMENTRATQETFRRLGELGAHVSIDDFGTGYSSLAYLRKLPAAELKIDRAMVMDIEHSADALAVVDAVVKLAHALSLKVVAEGVENQRQQQLLVDLGCDELQGFLFARPMSQRALLLWALGGRSDAPKFRASLFGETRAATPEQKAQTRMLSQQQGPVSAQPKGD